MENGFKIDINQILAHVEQAQVMSIYFPILGKSLLIDLRHDAKEGPYVDVAQVAPSVEHRLSEFERVRPRFGKPENLLAVPWVWRVKSFKETGVLGILVRRAAEAGGDEASKKCQEAYCLLLEAEREQQLSVIKGEGFRTIWERK